MEESLAAKGGETEPKTDGCANSKAHDVWLIVPKAKRRNILTSSSRELWIHGLRGDGPRFNPGLRS